MVIIFTIQFWKTITYSPPIYGADLTGSLMDQNAGSWNFNTLNSLLNYSLTEPVKGVTEPYCYIGSWKAFFSWHKEDLDLAAINYIHEGAPKIWYAIAKADSEKLESEAKMHFKGHAQVCSEFMRHKTFLINP
jgi:jumonji domain-containing protein 2